MTFHKRFHWDDGSAQDSHRAITRPPEKRSALADIVAHDGKEWIKVSTITEKRLLFEMAKAQWEEADSSSEDAEDEELVTRKTRPDRDIMARIDLVRTVDDLVRASRSHRIHYHNPSIRLVLPKIPESSPPGLSHLLDRIRSTGAIVDLGSPVQTNHTTEELPSKVFPRLLPSQHPPLTDTLNIDCTILLALVSDLSHAANHPILPTYNDAIQRQIELETREHLLPTSLWPAMAKRALVCTEEAARRMREIVGTIGTPNERIRTELVLENVVGGEKQQPVDDIRNEFAKYSDYDIPDSFQMPIKIVPTVSPAEIHTAIEDGELPSVGQQVADGLTDINSSVFMYGWVKGITTVSSNRSVAKWIETTIEQDGNGIGPDIWLREPARSLLGKEKERRK